MAVSLLQSALTAEANGQFKKAGVAPKKFVKEIRLQPGEGSNFEVGQELKVDLFAAGEFVDVVGTSKGKGFQGAVKRHHFKGGSRTHGQKHSEREIGSINGRGRVGSGRVNKGKRMPGRMGGDMVTVKNLKVLQVRPESNELVIHGSLPGRKGVLVSIVG